MNRFLTVISGIVLIVGTLVYVGATLSQSVKPSTTVSADNVLVDLKAGNDHHAQHKYSHPHETLAWQQSLIAGQHPEAEILSCSDSRVPPEIIFDQGLGDLFVVRVAGNVATDAEVASLEYGAEHLNISLLIVLGHENCGAVTAAVQGAESEGHIGTLMDLIKPAVEKTRGKPGNAVANAVQKNVELVVQQLRSSEPILSHLVAAGKLKIVGAVYSLETGRVTWLDN